MTGRYPLHVDEWLGVLEVAKKYFVDIAIQQSRAALTSTEARALLSPCSHLRIVWEFGLDDLYDEMVDSVLSIRPFPTFSLNDILDLEPELFTATQTIYQQASLARLRLISFVPDVQHSSAVCSGTHANRACELHWREAYGSFTRLLGHTEKYLSGRAVLEKMTRGQFLNMNDTCKAEMIDYIRPGFLKEEEIFREGKARLLNILSLSRPKTPRRSFVILQ
jgi:hypothetical protein